MILSITMNPSIDKVYLVENFSIGSVFRTKDYTATAGGKGLNVARVVKAMNFDIIASGLLGGLSGRFIKNRLDDLDIKDKFLNISGETRTCINITDNMNKKTTEILESGPEVKGDEIDKFLKNYRSLVDETEIIISSGSLPKGLSNDFYRELIKIANCKKKKFILDTSGRYLKEAIKEKPYMVKPNQEEVNNLFDINSNNIEDCIQPLIEFKKMGIKMPVITLGRQGSVGLNKNHIYHFKAPNVEAVNVVGSGDAFVAGCAIGLLKDNYIQTMKLAMACGVANTLFIQTGKVTKKKVNYYKDRIKVEKIYEL